MAELTVERDAPLFPPTGPFGHVTDRGAADSILRVGFEPGHTAWGRGVFVATGEDFARCASMYSFGCNEPVVVFCAVDPGRIVTVSFDILDDIGDVEEAADVVNDRLGCADLGAWARTAGFDTVWIRAAWFDEAIGGDQLMVLDPARVTPIAVVSLTGWSGHPDDLFELPGLTAT